MASIGHSTVEKVDTAAPGAAPWSYEEEEGAGQYFWGLAAQHENMIPELQGPLKLSQKPAGGKLSCPNVQIFLSR